MDLNEVQSALLGADEGIVAVGALRGGAVLMAAAVGSAALLSASSAAANAQTGWFAAATTSSPVLSAARSGVPAGTDLDRAREQARKLRVRVDALQADMVAAVKRYAQAQTALDAAATEELSGSRHDDALAAAAAADRARTGRAVRTLYMTGGPAALYAAALQGQSISEVLDRWAAVQDVVHSSGAALDRSDRAASSAATVQQKRVLTSDQRVRLVTQSRTALAQAALLNDQVTAALSDADATVTRLMEEQRAAEQTRMLAAQRAAAAAAARPVLGVGGVPGSPGSPGTSANGTSANGTSANGTDAVTAGGGVPGQAIDLISVLRRAGFAGEGLRVAWAVAMRESGGRADAIGKVNGNGTRDHGLFQLNDIHLGRVIDASMVYNADANAAAAFRMSSGGSNWSAWGLGSSGWAGHLQRDLPGVYAMLYQAFYRWYVSFPG